MCLPKVSFNPNYPKGHFDHKVQTATISIPIAEIIKNISQIKAGLSFFGGSFSFALIVVRVCRLLCCLLCVYVVLYCIVVMLLTWVLFSAGRYCFFQWLCVSLFLGFCAVCCVLGCIGCALLCQVLFFGVGRFRVFQSLCKCLSVCGCVACCVVCCELYFVLY